MHTHTRLYTGLSTHSSPVLVPSANSLQSVANLPAAIQYQISGGNSCLRRWKKMTSSKSLMTTVGAAGDDLSPASALLSLCCLPDFPALSAALLRASPLAAASTCSSSGVSICTFVLAKQVN